MQTPQEVKNWYLNDSYNSQIFVNSSGAKKADNYRFACTIPQTIIDLLTTKQSSNQIYLGSNLSVSEFTDGTIGYELFFYTYYYETSTKNYLIGKAIYTINNFSIDYLNYIKSCNYIVLNISASNLDLTVTQFSQAYKQGTIIGATRLDMNPLANTYFSLLDIYSKNTRSRYGVTNFKSVNFYNSTPIYVYNFTSRTLSTCKFASELTNQLKPASGLKGASFEDSGSDLIKC